MVCLRKLQARKSGRLRQLFRSEMKWKFILPALAEAASPLWRSIKYSLFPPLGLATLAGHLPEG